MPYFRFLIEGRSTAHDGGTGTLACNSIGFFTARTRSGTTISEARVRALNDLSEEWSTGISAYLTKSGCPALTVVDEWQVGIWRMLRDPNRGHTFFHDDEDAIAAAARIEAQVAHAPKDAEIWKLGNPSLSEK